MDPRHLKPWMKKAAILFLLVVFIFPATVIASWNILLNEHFQLPASTWPWSLWHLGCYG